MKHKKTKNNKHHPHQDLTRRTKAWLFVLFCTLFGGLSIKLYSAAAPAFGPVLFEEYSSTLRTTVLYVANIDGSDKRKIAEGVTNAAWSPDGRQIVASGAGASGWPVLIIMNADGSNRRQLTAPPAGYNDSAPSWSPDGTKVTFQRAIAANNTASYSVYVINADGTGDKFLAYQAAFPKWSPDGKSIAFARFPSEQALYVMNPDGSGQHRVYIGSGPYTMAIPGSWSPDSSRIAVAHQNSTNGQPILGVVSVNNGVMSSIGSPVIVNSIIWSPDGSKILYESSNSAGTYMINPDGSDLQKLAINTIISSWRGGVASPKTEAPVVQPLIKSAPVRAKSAHPVKPPEEVDTSDKQAPSKPSYFVASAGEESAAVVLNWMVSTDNVGVSGYKIERSLDNANWAVVAASLDSSIYTDETTIFNTKYYYRLTAYDAAGNSSQPATTEVTSTSFAANTDTEQSVTLTSNDDVLEVTISAGTLSVPAKCSVEKDSANLGPLIDGFSVVAGPYKVLCKDQSGAILTSTVPLPAKTRPPENTQKRYKLAYYGQENNEDWVKIEAGSSDEKGQAAHVLGTSSFAVMGQPKTRPLWITGLLWIGGIGVAAGAGVYAISWTYRRQLLRAYGDYYRKAHGL